MALPTYQEQLQGGMVSFDAPTIRARGPDMSPLRQAVQSWSVDLQRQEEEKAAQMQARLAEVQQTELGVAQIAQAPAVAERFQQVFQEQALATHSELLKTDATRTLAELSRRHQYDPSGLAASWSAYAKSQVEEIKKTDRAYAARVERSFESFADTAVERARAAAEAKAREQAKIQATIARADRWNAMQDMVRLDPTEANYLEQVQAWQQSVETDFRNGLMSPGEYVNETLRIADDLQVERVFGLMDQYTQDNDPVAASVLIQDLERGGMFGDNAVARRMANTIRSQFSSARDSVIKSELAHFDSRLDALHQSMQLGAPFDVEAVTNVSEQIDAMAPHMTPKQEIAARQKFNTVLGYQELRESVPQANIADLQVMGRVLQSVDANQFYGSGARELYDVVQNRVTELGTAAGAQDFAVFGALNNMGFAEIASMGPDAILRSRQQAAELSGRPIDQVLPYTYAQVDDGLGRIHAAMNAGDYATALGTWNAFMLPFDTPADAAMSIATADVNDYFAATAYTATMLPQADAQEFMAGAYQGKNLPPIGMGQYGRVQNSGLAEHIDAIAAIHPRMQTQLHSATGAFMAFQKAQNPSLSNDEIVARTADLLKNVEIGRTPRGLQYPKALLGQGPTEQKLVEQQVEAVFELNRADPRWDYAVPVRTQGGLTIMNGFTRDVMWRMDDTDPQLVTARQTDAEMLQEQQTKQLMNDARWKNTVPTGVAQFATDAGVPPEAANALQRALAYTPYREQGTLMNGVPVAAQKYVRETEGYRRIYQENPFITSFDGNRPSFDMAVQTEIGGRYFKEMYDRYKDTNKALAAYYIGNVQDADSIFEVAGDDWLDVVDTRIRNFVLKGTGQ